MRFAQGSPLPLCIPPPLRRVPTPLLIVACLGTLPVAFICGVLSARQNGEGL